MVVTIAIPVFNGGQYLRNTISSVLNQTFKDFELLIINDGSTDDSMDIAQSFKDQRIKIIDDGENRGLVYRLNQSIEMAKGIYYARMDADDIMHTDRIQRQIEFLAEKRDIDVVGTAIYSIDANNVIKGAFSVKEIITQGNLPGFVHPSVMGKTSWFKQNKYDAQYLRAEDLELWLRTRTRAKFANINEQLLFYREFGIPSMKKYYLSKITEIKIFSDFGKYNLSKSSAYKRIIRSALQIAVFFIATLIGQQDYIIKKRKRTPINFNMEISTLALNNAIKYIP